MTHLISANALNEILVVSPVRLLDVRWRLDQPEGRPDYLHGHLPGAVYVDLEHELASAGHPEDGRHPLPPLDDLQEALRRWGIGVNDEVIVYDDNLSVPASRAWWLLSRVGLRVRVLDGGLRAWIAAGHLLERGDVAPERGDAVLSRPVSGVLAIDEAAYLPQSGVLLDVRSAEQYRGVAASHDPVSGHIPGALNAPTTRLVDELGRLRPREELRHEFARFGVHDGRRVGLYCSSGIASAHSALALAEIGVVAEVYVGSWSQWSRTRSRPVAVGPLPAGPVHGN